MQAKDLLTKTQATNRVIGRQQIRQQLRQPENTTGVRTGYDAASGSFTVSPLSGGLQPVQSLTTAAFPVGRVVTVSSDGAAFQGNRRIDGVPA